MNTPIIVKAVFTNDVKYPAELERKLPKQTFAAIACMWYINTPISEVEVFASTCHKDRRVIGGYTLRLQLDYLPDNVYGKLVEMRDSRNLSAFVSFAYANMCKYAEGLSEQKRSDFLDSLLAEREKLYRNAKAVSQQPTQPTQPTQAYSTHQGYPKQQYNSWPQQPNL